MNLRSASLLLTLGLGLAAGAPGDAFTIDSPIVLVADDPQMASRLHDSLKRRFSNIVLRGSVAEARSAAGQGGGPEVAIVVATSRDRGTATAYGSSLEICHVMVTAQVLRLPSAALVFSKSGEGKGPDCAVASGQAAPALADELLKSLEEYRRQGASQDKEYLWVQLVDDWPEAELAKLRADLLGVPGIRGMDPDADAHLLKLEIYRDPRALAREMDRLESVRVSRFAGRRVTLSAVWARSAASAAGRSRSGPAASPPRRPASPVPAPPRPAAPATRASPSPELRVARLPSTRGSRWALVVGVSKYRDPAISTLTFPGKDARAFADVLSHPGVGRFSPDNVVVLLDNQATTRRIKMELDYLARMTQPEDLFLFFFSSHAAPGSRDIAGDAYLVTHDTELSSLYATGFPMRELVDALSSRIQAQTVVGILDACHTGQIVNRSSGGFQGAKSLTYEAPAGGDSEGQLSWSQEWQAMSEKSLSPPPAADSRAAGSGGKKVVFMSSSDGEQLSWESEALGHGVFTYYLMEALRQSQGRATVDSLFDFVKEGVKRTVLDERGQLQEPVLFYNAKADFPIGGQP